MLVGWLVDASPHDLSKIGAPMGSKFSNVIVEVLQCQFVLGKLLLCGNDCLISVSNIFMKNNVKLENSITLCIFLKGIHFCCDILRPAVV